MASYTDILVYMTFLQREEYILNHRIQDTKWQHSTQEQLKDNDINLVGRLEEDLGLEFMNKLEEHTAHVICGLFSSGQ